MADDDKLSEGIPNEDFVADQDPQSAIASQGMQQLAKLPQVQQALDFGGNLDAYDSMVKSAIAGNPSANEALAQRSLGTAMGTLKLPEGEEGILPTSHRGLPDRLEAAKELLNNPELDQTQLSAATDRMSRELAKQRPAGRPKRMADGGIPDSEFVPDSVQEAAVPNLVQNSQIRENNPSLNSQHLDSSIQHLNPSSQHLDTGIPDSEFQPDEDTYGTPTEMAKTALEGAARGVAGPLAPLAETALGVDPEAIRLRAETNPITAGVGEVSGLAGSLLTGIGEGALAAKAGEAVSGALGLAEASGLMSRLGSAAAKGAIENMTIGASDDVSRMIINDPGVSVGSAVADLGLNALLGGAIGGASTGVGALWHSKFGGDLGQVIEDFKGRMDEHINNPDPVHALTEELNTHYTNVKDMADEVYGPKGLKAEAIAKSIPEMNQKIINQMGEVNNVLETGLEKLKNDDHLGLLEDEVGKYNQAISSNEPAKIFEATQDLKKQLQEWGKFNANITPLKEKQFRDTAKGLAFELRNALEDHKVWGDAAKVQQDINGAFSKFINPLKQFEQKFTSKITDMETGKITNIIDPAKINTYINQLSKPNAELKKSMLSNFLEASGKYKDAIDKTYGRLGVESPIPPSSLARTMATLEEPTTGSKIADIFIKKGLTEAGGQTTGAAVGGALGHAIGVPGFGAIIGAHALGPFFSSILPAIVKPLVTSEASAAGLKAATDYGVSVAKGMKLVSQATKNLFKASSEVLPQSALPSIADRDRLDNTLKKMQTNPMTANMADNHIGAYLPNHGTSVAQTAGLAAQYLNSLRTPQGKQNPLDSNPTPNAIQKAAFERALTIAQQPLMVLDFMKKGTLIPSDIVSLKTLYPNLYTHLQNQITDKMMEAIDKKTPIPYKTRLNMSAFLGYAMDSTMTQRGIAGAQPMPNQAPPQGGGSPNKAKRGSAPLTKLPGMYQTPLQNAEKDKANRH